MKHFTKLFFVLVILFLTSCAGTKFVKMPENSLILGKTTKQEILTSMGKPFRKGVTTINGISLETVVYAYATTGGKAASPGVTPARSQAFYFKENVLVGKEYTSSFDEDKTIFDAEKAKSIQNSQQKSNVLNVMGEAKGEYIYPLITDKTGSALVYMFVQTKGFKSKSDVFVVEFDQNQIVTNTRLTSTGAL